MTPDSSLQEIRYDMHTPASHPHIFTSSHPHTLIQAYKQVVNDTSVFKLDLPSTRAK